MTKLPSSIFNEVIGPVMTGPSSSHTAAPTRIGNLSGQLAGGTLSRVEITFETNGSFATTYRGQKSDQGLAAGLLGMLPQDSRLSDALSLVRDEGIDLKFLVKDFEAEHPNVVLLDIQDEKGGRVFVKALSTGGGRIELNEINGCPVYMAGDYHELVIMLSEHPAFSMEQLCSKVESKLAKGKVQVHGSSVSDNSQKGEKWRGVIVIHSRQRLSPECLEDVKQLCGSAELRQVAPVMPVLASARCEVPFTRAEEMLSWCVEHDNAPLWKAAVTYEAARGNVDESEVVTMMEYLAGKMEEAITTGLTGDFSMRGFLMPTASGLQHAVKERSFIPTGMLDAATVMAVAVMELNSSMGCVVAAPTAGSCGVLPAAVFSALDALGVPDDCRMEVAAKALLSAGLIGVFISEQSTFATEVCGCQAECGSAASMAAGALVNMAGGSAQAACDAAAVAMQNSLGLTCDPVAEQVEVPCIGRNVSAVSNAVTSANLAMHGFKGNLPFDDVICAMWEVGNSMSDTLRCTGKGGLCTTPSGVKIKEEVDRIRFAS
ncbi:L-serine ammonia-lyase, iron-sulfur-dependent, subunit alpha [Halodesulfovibrio marinisediminis]|uniref:L-serine ammonia-lyase n=1 Tax=Halodesulfovibrio marinisediminis DSM 17456 TaxID=1121457 RepID=A0A1N6FUJ8_9BACT|nr:L-serine ammonia-lyase, iron-sulfur-dependent, subunit alpha [Halodesulfovibrio marinisediminis]SIN98841.1 L-serine dehydratase [Halodesulfovibrio marinisediminis DSM 17456]